MSNDNIILTGGSGFIGSNLLEKLKKKKIFIISRKKTKISNKHKILICNLENKKKLKKIFIKVKPKLVIHLAWTGIPKFTPNNYKKNLKITKNLIECINESNCKKILISGSCAEYGENSNKVLETSNLKKRISNLGKHKKNIKNFLLKNLNKKKIIIWTRIFYVYGSNQRKNSLLPTLIEYMKKKKQFNVNKPNLINDYIYIKDVVSAIIKCINIKKSTTLNICSGKPTSNYKFIKTFEKLSNYKIINKKSVNKKKYGFYGSNQVLKKLKWREKYNVETGIKDTLNGI